MKYSAPTNTEIKEIINWLESAPNVPPNILNLLKKILSVYSNLTQSALRAKQTLNTLRQAMGIIPKSEKGSSEPEVQPFLPGFDETTQKTIDELREKKAEAERQRQLYHNQLKKLIAVPIYPRQLEFDFGQPEEMLFSWPTSDREKESSKQKVERMKEFGRDKGLRSTYDTTKRVNLEITVTEIEYQVETVEDIQTGKKVRASMIEQGPSQFQMTWKAIANLIKLHVGFAIPINRIELMIGQPEFSTSKICRIFEYIATQLLPVYLVLAEKLADAGILSGDDTVTKILELDAPKENSLAQQIDQHFGWAAEKANGTGLKKALNVSLLMGKTEADPRSTIRFFRTHTGSVGNLMGKLLEWREPKFKNLIFQGDMSSTNLPSLELREKFNFLVGGCGAHARRPFWKHREEDVDLCYFMLRGFVMLSQIEKRIDLRGRTSANILKYRNRYGRMIWESLRYRCKSAVAGKVMSRIPPKFGIMPKLWPTGMELNQACNYVINNFEALTLYLSTPHLQYTNNGSERALRIEKCMLSGSKFRKTRNGRAVLDVLRTINATCTAANIDIGAYLKCVFKNTDKLQSNPEELTPFAVAIALDLEKTATNKK